MEITHAKVRFIDDNFKAVVPIKKIIEFGTQLPQSISDFNKQKIYTCLWKDEKNPEELELGVQIADLAIISNEEELEAFDKKRANLPVLHMSTIEEYTDKCDKNVNCDGKTKQNKDTNEEQKLIDKKVIAAEAKIQRNILLSKISNFTNCSDLKSTSNKSSLITNNKGNLEAFDANLDNECCKQLFKKYEIELKNNQKLMKENEVLQETIQTLRVINDYLQKELFVNQRVKLSCIDTNTMPEKIMPNKKDSYVNPVHEEASPAETEIVSTVQKTRTPHNSSKLNNKSILNNISVTNNTSTPYKICSPVSEISSPFKICSPFSNISTPRVTYKRSKTSTPIGLKYSSKTLSENVQDTTIVNKKSCRRRLIETNTQKSYDSDFDITELENENCEFANPKRQRLMDINNKTETKKDSPKMKQDKKNTETNKSKKDERETKQNKEKAKTNESEKDAPRTKQNKEKSETNESETDAPKIKQDGEKTGSKFGDKWVKTENNKKVKMIFISDDISLDNNVWKSLKSCNKPSLFTKKLFRELYHNDPEIISRRSISGDPNLKTPNKIHSRIKISPEKDYAISKCVRYYLSKPPYNLTGNDLDKAVDKKNHYISEDITATVKKLSKQ